MSIHCIKRLQFIISLKIICIFQQYVVLWNNFTNDEQIRSNSKCVNIVLVINSAVFFFKFLMCSFKSFIIFWVCANCIKQCWVERWLYKGSIHSGGKTELMTCSVFSSTNYKCISCSRTLWDVDRPNWGSSYRLWHVNAPIIAYLTGCVSWYMHIFAYILLPFFYFAELFYSLSRITFLLPFASRHLH